MARLSSTLHADALNALPSWARQANQSATYPRMFVQVAERHGLSRAQILASAGLPETLLDDPAGRLSLQAIWQILDAILTLGCPTTLAFEAGLSMPLTAHGSLGYALMCANTPRQAINILERFWHLRGRGFVLTVEQSGSELFFEVSVEAALPPTLRDVQLNAILTSMYQAMQFMMAMQRSDDEIWLQGTEPDGFDRWREQLPTVRFSMPRAGISLQGDLSVLDQPLPTANPEALAQALGQCERESAMMADDSDIVRRIRAAMTPDSHGYPTPEQLAATLHLTPRTFRRRLQEQGQSYQQLLEEARRRDSCRLLMQPELEIRQVGELLGYTDPANFTRAFKGWTGRTPSQWRQAQQP
ncbi:helix-turn-helix domain-containing protein [Alcanivorax sp. 1008]|uniref:helix-turn-helix domain-containing protein n=1 Tax=Alcanivorax sp. 1008 TaxID=2816853 RepID=UPI00351D4B87